jgi:hypothetical protein
MIKTRLFKAESIENILKCLNSANIKTNYTDLKDGRYNRIIEFEVEGIKYYIQWFVNQSYLKISNEHSCPHIPFRFIYINPNSPNSKHKYQLCFFDILESGDQASIFYNPCPFGSFKIPFNF